MLPRRFSRGLAVQGAPGRSAAAHLGVRAPRRPIKWILHDGYSDRRLTTAATELQPADIPDPTIRAPISYQLITGVKFATAENSRSQTGLTDQQGWGGGFHPGVGAVAGPIRRFPPPKLAAART